MSKFLRFQTLALLSASLVLILSIASAWLYFLSSNTQAYRDLIEGPLQASHLIDEANLQFKVQVQEWKSIPLRGKTPSESDELWSTFENQEHRVQDTLKRVSVLDGVDPAVKVRLEKLIEAHRSLGGAYRKARDAFVAANAESVAGHQTVASMDRDVRDQMSQLVVDLRNQSNAQALETRADASQTIFTGALVLLAAALLVCLITLLSSRRFVDLV